MRKILPYASGFLAELHCPIWGLCPCILAILQDKMTSLIGDLLHRLFFLIIVLTLTLPELIVESSVNGLAQ